MCRRSTCVVLREYSLVSSKQSLFFCLLLSSLVARLIVRMSSCFNIIYYKPPWHVTSHLGQLSRPSLRGKLIEYRPVWLHGLTCKAGCVHLCRVEGKTV